MENQKPETQKELLIRLQKVAATMTQDQVDACGWFMGAYQCGWTPKNLAGEFQHWIDRTED